MSNDYDEDDGQEVQVVEIEVPAYEFQVQDVIGIGFQTLAGCLTQVAYGFQAVGNELLAAGNLRRRHHREVQARVEAAAAMGLLGTQDPS